MALGRPAGPRAGRVEGLVAERLLPVAAEVEEAEEERQLRGPLEPLGAERPEPHPQGRHVGPCRAGAGSSVAAQLRQPERREGPAGVAAPLDADGSSGVVDDAQIFFRPSGPTLWDEKRRLKGSPARIGQCRSYPTCGGLRRGSRQQAQLFHYGGAWAAAGPAAHPRPSLL